ncbi:MAG: glycine cleavage system protein GcvH [Dehalococcoidia bacterium]
MEIRDSLRYTHEHEWIRLEGDEGVIGISDYAQDELGDVVYVALPALGTRLVAGQRFGEIESVKTVSELFAPATGEVTAVNEAIEEHPELVNESPYDDGWLVRIVLTDPTQLEELLDAEAYGAELPAAG